MKYVLAKTHPCSTTSCDQRHIEVGCRMAMEPTESVNEAYRKRAKANNETDYKFSCLCKWEVKEIEDKE